MLSILTHSNKISTAEFWRYFLSRYILGRKRGPDAVKASLVRGLKILNFPFVVDQQSEARTMVVLSGIEALQETILKKQKGLIDKIIAGPNITIHPHDHNRLMCTAEINVILVPSKWVQDFWVKEAPEIAHKICIWPAGVAISQVSSRGGKPVIYDKIGDPILLAQVQKSLNQETILFSYGSFSRSAYLEALKDAPFLIYLAKSESQGLALQEAWAHDVPTIVNHSEHWVLGNLSWQAEQINAPYLTSKLGEVFKKPEEIPTLIKKVSQLNPKIPCDKNLSDQVSAEKLLEII